MKKFLFVFTLLFLVGTEESNGQSDPLDPILEYGVHPVDSLRLFVKGQYPHIRTKDKKGSYSWVLDTKHAARGPIWSGVILQLERNKLISAGKKAAADVMTIDSILNNGTFEEDSWKPEEAHNSGWNLVKDKYEFYLSKITWQGTVLVSYYGGIRVVLAKGDCMNLLMVKNKKAPTTPATVKIDSASQNKGKKDTLFIVLSNNNSCCCEVPIKKVPQQGIQPMATLDEYEDEEAFYILHPQYKEVYPKRNFWSNFRFDLQFFMVGGQRQIGYYDPIRPNYPIFIGGGNPVGAPRLPIQGRPIIIPGRPPMYGGPAPVPGHDRQRSSNGMTKVLWD